MNRLLKFRVWIIFLIISNFYISLYAQTPTGNIFLDTEPLLAAIKGKNGDLIITYLKTLNIPFNKATLQANKHLKPLFTDDLFNASGIIKSAASPDAIMAVAQGGGVLDAILPPTQTINVIGSTVAKRFREEINIAYLVKFKDFIDQKININGNDYQIIGMLFPKTKNVISTVKPYKYTTFLETLRQAFDKDLEMLPQNISEVFKIVPITDTDVKNSLILFSVSLQEVTTGVDILQVLSGLDIKTETNALSKNPKNVLKLTALTVRNAFYKNLTKKLEPVDPAVIQKILRDFQQRELCIGLLMEKEKDALDHINPAIYTTLDTLANVQPVLEKLGSLTQILDTSKKIAKTIKAARDNGLPASINDYLAYMESIIPAIIPPTVYLNY